MGTEFSVKYVDAGGVRTRALQAGQGEDLIFLHGTSGHLEAFSRNIAAHAEHFRCHAIDMLGHGLTEKPDYLYERARYVEHLLAYMDAEKIDKAHLCGESLGGTVAAWFASEHPERIGKLSLVAAGGTVANPANMKRLKETTTEAAMNDDPALTRKRLELLMFEPEGNVTDELVDIRYRVYHQPDFQQNLDNLLCLQDMEVRSRNLLDEDRMARIQAPTLVVWPRENPLGEMSQASEMHEGIRGSELVIFEGCGHWPQYEQPERFNEAHLAFLRGTAAP